MEVKTFPSARNIYTVSLLWLTAFFMIIILFIEKQDENEPSIYIFYTIMTATAALLLWILSDTKYKLNEKELYYYCGPFRGKIDIASIRKISYDDSFLKTQRFKPALGRKGIVVYYNKFSDMYISPKERELFISELLRINPGIQLV